MSDLSRELASFAINTRYEDLPRSVVHEAKRVLLDSIGDALSSLSIDKGKMTVAVARRLAGPPESSILGVAGKVSCLAAAFANGDLIMAADYDAMTPGNVHVPTFVIPATLALAESVGAAGRDLILGIAVAHEIAARVASAASSTLSIEGPEGQIVKSPKRYGHAACNFGAAAGAGRMVKLDEQRMVHAMGIAGHFSQVPDHQKNSFSAHRAMTKWGGPGWQSWTSW